MLNSRNHLSEKRNYLFGLILLLAIASICGAFSSDENEDFDLARREVLLRRIGHEILLQSGDRTSRVLPIQKIATNKYQIKFEKEFAFLPDSLMRITRRFLDNEPLSNTYTVNVLNCNDSSITYGFAISKNKKDDIVTCIGRRQPKACYMIRITFQPKSNLNRGYLLSGLFLVSGIGFMYWRMAKPHKMVAAKPEANTFVLGSVMFDAFNKKLLIEDKTVDLTGTETRVLLIFASLPNETITRARLQKEIWEDEGVVVGRSLDMFISKLRKKLEVDPNIKIVVIRGKGYKLEIGA